MAAFFVYSLKSSLCLAAFYLFYKLLVSRDTFHRFNRITLLGMMMLSTSIPWVAWLITPAGPALEIMTDISSVQPEIINPTSSVTAENAPPNRLLSLILLLYLTGCVLYFLQSAWTLCRILRLIRQGERIRVDNNIMLTIHSDQRIAPFSWMKNMVASRTDLNEAGETILLHEQAHIRQHHSFDLLLAELCLLFQWYNPAAWLLYRELQHIHEFEADRSVLAQGIDAKQYQLLIIKKAVGTRLYSMANSFNHSNLKKRITMMLQKKSNSWARLKYAYVLPLAAISVIAFARPEISESFDGISNAKVSNLILKVEPPEAEKIFSETPPPIGHAVSVMETDETPALPDPKTEVTPGQSNVPAETKPVNPNLTPPIVTQNPDTMVFEIVEDMPEFSGGMQALMKYLSENLKYPYNAMQQGIQGSVMLQFIVEKDGSLTNIHVLRGIDSEIDAEALRVVREMPKWIPGKQRGQIVRVKFSLPVRFRLQQ